MTETINKIPITELKGLFKPLPSIGPFIKIVRKDTPEINKQDVETNSVEVAPFL